MRHLDCYLEETNRVLKIFNDEIFVLPLSQERYEDLVNILGNAMSAPTSGIRRGFYKAVEKELQNHASGLGLAIV